MRNSIIRILLGVICICSAHYKCAYGFTQNSTNDKASGRAFIREYEQTLDRRIEECIRAELRIRKLSPRRQRLEIAKLPSGVYVNLPYFWQSQQDPTNLLNAVKFYGEPLGVDMLNALERLLPTFRSDFDRIQVATLLYRYNRGRGKDYLHRQSIKHNDALAASVLALNRDPIIARNPKLFQDKEHGALLESIENWSERQFVRPILDALHENRSRTQVLSAITAQKMKEASPWLERRFEDPSCTLTERIYVATAILSINVDKGAEMIKFLDDTYLASSDEDVKMTILVSLSNLYTNRPFGFYRRAILHFLKSSEADYTIDEKILCSENLAVTSCIALAKLNSKLDSALVEQVLTRLYQRGRLDMYESEATRSLYKLNPHSKFLKNAMGSQWLARRGKMIKLKRIPDSLKLNGFVVVM